MTKILEHFRAFSNEEDGIALTEYLILLGLLVGGVIAAVIFAGEQLDVAWRAWGGFWDDLGPDGQMTGGNGEGEG